MLVRGIEVGLSSIKPPVNLVRPTIIAEGPWAVILIGGDGEGKRGGFSFLITFPFLIGIIIAIHGRLSASLELLSGQSVAVDVPYTDEISA